jgi:3-deoxy-manno-octulosonate cytidylyltransferase (CMP-KDO synthetase)
MILGIIPARYASTRFPGKPLVDIGGRSMVRRVYEQASAALLLDRVVVATDDERILDHVRAFGGECFLTRADHPSGTDRCAEVARLFPEAELVVNIQGDEPFIQPGQIDLLAETLRQNPRFPLATLAKRIEQAEALFNPNVVKVVFSEKAGAIYFSRQPLPFYRGAGTRDWLQQHAYFKHIGLYGYRRRMLLRLARLRPTPLERAESLEQLRWLEHGLRIKVAVTELETIGIDSPEDLKGLPPAPSTFLRSFGG